MPVASGVGGRVAVGVMAVVTARVGVDVGPPATVGLGVGVGSSLNSARPPKKSASKSTSTATPPATHGQGKIGDEPLPLGLPGRRGVGDFFAPGLRAGRTEGRGRDFDWGRDFGWGRDLGWGRFFIQAPPFLGYGIAGLLHYCHLPRLHRNIYKLEFLAYLHTVHTGSEIKDSSPGVVTAVGVH